MKHIIFLHGALGAGSQLKPLADIIQTGAQKHIYTFAGHGGKPMPAAPFSIAGFADELLAYMNDRGIGQADIFGYSMGGYVGMYIAMNHPERIGALCTLATKWYWDTATAEREGAMLNPDMVIEKVPAFAGTLEALHAPSDWKTLMLATAKLLCDMGEEPPVPLAKLSTVNTPVMLCLGDEDKMVPLSETEEVCGLLQNASLEIINNTKHPLDRTNITALAEQIRMFLNEGL